jgi:hypothetical protein
VICFRKHRILEEWICIKVEFELKTLGFADPVPLDVLQVLESFLIPLLDLKMEGAELFPTNKRMVYVRRENKLEQVLTVPLRKILHKDA